MTIFPLDAPGVTLETAGGKGANLGRLARAGFNVPPGFIIGTDSYISFVSANYLGEKIESALSGLSAEDSQGLERASAEIRAAFSASSMPADLADSIRRAYGDLEPPLKSADQKSAVAVRSSATTEDLPDLSFAGQQDTYLNVLGPDQLLRAVVDCWSSLWTARAIGYRLRNEIPHEGTALAVVVQQLVPSDASGVLFTANPLTGLRSQMVIDATLGLGEALVSGQVEPDHYLVNSPGGEIVEKKLGAKNISIHARAGGGTERVAADASLRQALSDDQIRRLAALGEQVLSEYGSPQDIEWALTGESLYLLQSRAITSLFPLPELAGDRHPQQLDAWFSFGAVQGLLGPITPLGSDTFRCVFAGGARMFHVHVAYDEQRILAPAGERLWIKFSDALRHPLGARFMGFVLPMIEPSVAAILADLRDEPGLALGKGRFRLSTAWRLLRFAVPILGRMVAALLRPERARSNLDQLVERQLSNLQLEPAGDMYARLAGRLERMKSHMSQAFPLILPRFIPVFGSSLGMLNLLNHLGGQASGADHGFSALVLEVTRALPNNVTTEMDLSLWATAETIRADLSSLAAFTSTDAPELSSRYLSGTLPEVAQQVMHVFLSKYGARGVGEIDIGLPRWREEPTPIVRSLQSYLQITDPDAAPDALFARGQQNAQTAIEQLAANARRERGGWLKERVVRFAARRVRVLLGVREAPKFYAVRMIAVFRQQLLESAAELVGAGILAAPEDLFMLSLHEVEVLCRGEARDWRALVGEHRAAFAREARRRQIPRVLVSDGRTFYEGLGAQAEGGELISGSPVSPGVVEGLVKVVLDPHETQLAPGEILVCPGTDPAWTPLFMAAGGLVTEVGGMMTHGSVVAREYGIPAVVGVHQATQRLRTGQKIRLDGTAGKIVVIG